MKALFIAKVVLLSFLLSINSNAQSEKWANARVDGETGKLKENIISISDKDVILKLFVHDPVKEELVPIEKQFEIIEIYYFSKDKRKLAYILKEKKEGKLYTMPVYRIDEIRTKMMVSELLNKTTLFSSVKQIKDHFAKNEQKFLKVIGIGKVFYQYDFHEKINNYRKINKIGKKGLLKWIEKKKDFVVSDSEIIKKIYYPISTIEIEIYQEVLIKNKFNPYIGQYKIQRAFSEFIHYQEALNLQHEYFKELEKLGLY